MTDGNFVHGFFDKPIDNAVEFWLQRTDIDTRFIHADIDLSEKREIKRIDNIRSGKTRLKSDSASKTSLSQFLGRCRSGGQVIECGRFLELWVSAESFHIGNGVAGAKMSSTTKERQETYEQMAVRVNHRARKQIRRIVNANDFRGMYTLTLAPPSADNDRHYHTIPYALQRNYDFVRKLHHNFQVKMKKMLGNDWVYLAVFEQHDSDKTSPDKRFTWHIHIAASPDITTEECVRVCWMCGRIDKQDFRLKPDGAPRDDAVENPGAYLAEYIGKDGAQFGEKDLINKRRYTTSRNIIKPSKKLLEYVEFEEKSSFDELFYKGKVYRNVFYNAKQVPGTERLSITATYMEVTS